MIQPSDIPRSQVIDSLYSHTCPACGSHKQSEHSLCRPCFLDLPHAMRADLYKRVGQGYEMALVDALNHLSAEKFHTERAP